MHEALYIIPTAWIIFPAASHREMSARFSTTAHRWTRSEAQADIENQASPLIGTIYE
jgi:hypothetical protein